MIPQLGKHAHHPTRWRTKPLAVICALSGFITFIHLYRSNFNVLPQPEFCTVDNSIAPTTKPGFATWDWGYPGAGNEPLIPHKIWQNYFADDIDVANLADAASWLALNKDFSYTLIGVDGADNFVNKHFADDPVLLSRYHSLPNFGMKSDLLRYIVLSVEGGVYTDMDTEALTPIRRWVPATMRRLARAVIGIEFDKRDGGDWVDIFHELQFCQWTIAAAPGHPIFRDMIGRALGGFAQLEEKHNKSLALLRPTNAEVLNTTGPAAWTEVVFDHLRKVDFDLKTLSDLSWMKEPTLYGDVLVLPVDGFGMGQPHSGSTNDGSIPDGALVRHNFRGKWRETG